MGNKINKAPMSVYLAKLAALAFRRPWQTLAAWGLLVLVVSGLLMTQPRHISSGITLRDTPSQQTLDRITHELPQADGAQGYLVFTASDGTRVDTPAREEAIARALEQVNASGLVIDRETAIAKQRDAVESKIRGKVEAKVADSLRPKLTLMSDDLHAHGEMLQGLGNPAAGQILALAERSAKLSRSQPSWMIIGASQLVEELEVLKSQGASIGMGGPALVPQKLQDPRVQVNRAVSVASEPVLAELDTLLLGRDPSARPLRVGQAQFRTVAVSRDGTVAAMSIQLGDRLSDLPADVVDDLLGISRDEVAQQGLTVAATSTLRASEPPLGGRELVGLAIAAMVLWLTLGSMVAAGLPLLTAMTGVFLGVGAAFGLSAQYDMTSSTPALALMIGLAVGLDYALFIIHKYRSLLAKGQLPSESVVEAVGTSGSAVLFAGTTVVIALLGLLTLQIGFITVMALTAATTVVLAVLLSITAIPALLGLSQSRVRPSQIKRSGKKAHWVASGWTRVLSRRPLLIVGAIATCLGLLAIPASDIRLGMPAGDVAPNASEARITYDAMATGFGAGSNGPLAVVARRADGKAMGQAELLQTQAHLYRISDVASVKLVGANESRSMAIFQVIPDAGPTDPTTQRLVKHLRQETVTDLEPLEVTGQSALNIDLTEVLAAAIPTYLVVIVGLSLLVLLLVFRSVFLPIAATSGFLLTIVGTMGLMSLVFSDARFTWVVGLDRPGPILSFLPIMASGILYGLAMDYQVFLGTSMREAHVRGVGARQAVVDGFSHSSRVVFAAAVIMVSVFGGFVLTDDTMIRQFGFALSVGILIDAFLIRMTLMPALLLVVGEVAWWLPRWLDELLPKLDLEGTQLRQDE